MLKYERLIPIRECNCKEFKASGQCKHTDFIIKRCSENKYEDIYNLTNK